MIQTAMKLGYGAATLALSFLLAVPLRAEDASEVLSGVVINPGGAVRSRRQNLPEERNCRPHGNDLAEVEIT